MPLRAIVSKIKEGFEMKGKLVLALSALLVFGLVLGGCDIDGGKENLRYSIQVNNQAASARTIGTDDTVELYINNLEYCEDAYNRALILVAQGDRDMGSKGKILNNAGWYSVNANLPVTNDVNNGPYSSFHIKIAKLRINETEYEFPRAHVFFGHPRFTQTGDTLFYPDNFSGITITDSVVSLKTILTVDPNILDTDGKLVANPYAYITVEGKINE
jgi:hypothetical protein